LILHDLGERNLLKDLMPFILVSVKLVCQAKNIAFSEEETSGCILYVWTRLIKKPETL
jgi:hypothetical protein